MPRLVRSYGQNHFHFITTSTYHRARLFDAEPFRNLFVRALGQVRDSLEFRLIRYVQVLAYRGQFSAGDGLPPVAADTANCAASAPPPAVYSINTAYGGVPERTLIARGRPGVVK